MTKMQKLLAMVLFGALFVSDVVGTGCPTCGGKKKEQQQAIDQLQNPYQINQNANQAMDMQNFDSDKANQLNAYSFEAPDRKHHLNRYSMLGAADGMQGMDQGLQSGIFQHHGFGGRGRRNRPHQWGGNGWSRWNRWNRRRGGRRSHRDWDMWNMMRGSNMMDQNAMQFNMMNPMMMDQNMMMNQNPMQFSMMGQNPMMMSQNPMMMNQMMFQNPMQHNMMGQQGLMGGLNALMGQDQMMDQNALQYNMMRQNPMMMGQNGMMDMNNMMGMDQLGAWSDHGRRRVARKHHRWGGRGMRIHSKGLQGRTINLGEAQDQKDQMFGANTKIPQIQVGQDAKDKKVASTIQF